MHMDLGDKTSDNILSNNQRQYAPVSYDVLERVIYTSATQGPKGFTVGSSSVVADDESLQEKDFYEYTVTTALGALSLDGHSFPSREETPNNTLNSWAINEAANPSGESHPTQPWESRPRSWHMYYNKLRTRTNASNTSGAAFMQTVLGNCEAVVVGKKTVTTKGDWFTVNNTLHDKWHGGGMYWVHRNFNYVISLIEEYVGNLYVSPEPHTTDGIISSGTSVRTDYPGTSDVTEIILYEDRGAGTLSEAYTASATPPLLQEYFAPTISDPGTGTTDTSRSSILTENNKLNHAIFDVNGGFINDSAVGWS